MSLAGNSLSPVPIWRNYLDVQNDVKPFLQFNALQANHDTMLQLVTDAICSWAQQFLGQPIAPTPFTYRFSGWSGWNGANIVLPYHPILEVTSAIEYWGVSGPHVLEEQTPTNQVNGFQVDYTAGILTRVFPGLVQQPWFPGSRNIEISWVAGYNPIPPDVKLATLEDIADWWRNTQQQAAGARAGYGGNEAPEGTGFAGLPNRIRALLEPRLSIGMG